MEQCLCHCQLGVTKEHLVLLGFPVLTEYAANQECVLMDPKHCLHQQLANCRVHVLWVINVQILFVAVISYAPMVHYRRHLCQDVVLVDLVKYVHHRIHAQTAFVVQPVLFLQGVLMVAWDLVLVHKLIHVLVGTAVFLEIVVSRVIEFIF